MWPYLAIIYRKSSNFALVMTRILLLLLSLCLTICAKAWHPVGYNTVIGEWKGTWATAMQVPVKTFMPYNNQMSDRSVRQVIKVSAGGKVVRLLLSNVFSGEAVVLRSVYIAHAIDSFRVDAKSARYLKFNGDDGVVIRPGKSVFSDALTFDLKPLEKVAITVNYAYAPKSPTVHMGSRTTSYILKGVSKPETDFSKAFRYEKWFNIAALEVLSNNVRGIAIIGNSITDGKGSTTDQQNRWPDEMSYWLNGPFKWKKEEKAKAANNKVVSTQWGVLNLGIGNNRVLSYSGYGEAAKIRFDRDILGQHGVTDVVIFEGINDLGTSKYGVATAYNLIMEYRKMIEKCHKEHKKVYLATITPMRGSGYYSADHEEGRRIVNSWIRTQKVADGFLDFDALMRDPKSPTAMRRGLCLRDHLHPNAAGYKEMGRYAADFFDKTR